VADHGAGIPQQFRERVFQRFAQADSADSRRKGGTGLGLSICKAIVEEHGGRIWFETSEGEGTSFFVELPAVTI
jgi:signal transduction histidine kinase